MGKEPIEQSRNSTARFLDVIPLPVPEMNKCVYRCPPAADLMQCLEELTFSGANNSSTLSNPLALKAF